MLTSIEIKNFKSIKKKQFELKNLNVLLGLNGMGKSSFIQSLLLLRQSENMQRGELKLNGIYTRIGNTKDALYQYSKDEGLSISLQFNDSRKFQLEFDYKIESDIFSLKSNALGLSDLWRDFYDYSLFSNNFQYLNASRIEPTSIQNKSYTNVVNQRSIGIQGEFAAHFIEVFGNSDVVFENVLHKDSTTKDPLTNKEFTNRTLINQINLWMGEISPGVNVRTTSIPNTENVLLEYVFKQPSFGNTNRFKPTNVGFGISYVLPIVTALLAAKPGELLIIENPESHVHPRGQVEIGKLISLVSNNNVQIILETHSDHILNGIRVAVKEDEQLEKKVALFYFERTVTQEEQYSKITDIAIDKNGELSEYPSNLLDEWSNQLLKLI